MGVAGATVKVTLSCPSGSVVPLSVSALSHEGIPLISHICCLPPLLTTSTLKDRGSPTFLVNSTVLLLHASCRRLTNADQHTASE